MSFTFTQSLMFNIEKLVGTLKSEEQLKEVLKRKFTKKEYKVFIAMESNEEKTTIANELKIDKDRVDELYKSACKKLNQERIKQELVNL